MDNSEVIDDFDKVVLFIESQDGSGFEIWMLEPNGEGIDQRFLGKAEYDQLQDSLDFYQGMGARVWIAPLDMAGEE